MLALIFVSGRAADEIVGGGGSPGGKKETLSVIRAVSEAVLRKRRAAEELEAQIAAAIATEGTTLVYDPQVQRIAAIKNDQLRELAMLEELIRMEEQYLAEMAEADKIRRERDELAVLLLLN